MPDDLARAPGDDCKDKQKNDEERWKTAEKIT